MSSKVIPWDIFLATEKPRTQAPKPRIEESQIFNFAVSEALKYLGSVQSDEQLIGTFQNDVEIVDDGVLYKFSYFKERIHGDERDTRVLEVYIKANGCFDQLKNVGRLVMDLDRKHFASKDVWTLGATRKGDHSYLCIQFHGEPKRIQQTIARLRISMQFGKKVIKL